MTTRPIPERLNGEASRHRSPAPFGSGACCPRFNLFRHKLLDDLLCAVREDYPVPAFVNGDTWTFAGPVNEAAYGLVERNWSGATEGVRLMGFYLFQSVLGHRQVHRSLNEIILCAENNKLPTGYRDRSNKPRLALVRAA